jgi:hypothetical protein
MPSHRGYLCGGQDAAQLSQTQLQQHCSAQGYHHPHYAVVSPGLVTAMPYRQHLHLHL